MSVVPSRAFAGPYDMAIVGGIPHVAAERRNSAHRPKSPHRTSRETARNHDGRGHHRVGTRLATRTPFAFVMTANGRLAAKTVPLRRTAPEAPAKLRIAYFFG